MNTIQIVLKLLRFEEIFILFENLNWLDIVDILLITLVVYQLFSLFHRTKGFRILIGLFGLVGIYLFVRSWGLFLSTLVFQIFWQALIILIIIVFQPEIRDVLARVNFLDFIQGKKLVSPDALKVDLISHAVFQMAGDRTGAIIIFKQKDDLRHLIKDGIPLNGEISEPVILSIFQKHSAVHDGAVLIDEGRIKTVAGYLPMTERENLPSRYGSRHRASLGISEKSDAFVVVVSEETGDVSVVQSSQIKKVKDENTLSNVIMEHFYRTKKQKKPYLKSLFSNIFIENWIKKVISFVLVFTIWAILAGQQNYSKNLIVQIDYKKIPYTLELVSAPPNANISIKGLRKLVSSLKTENIRIELDVSLAQWGRRTFYISQNDVTLPAGVQLLYVEPSVVKLDFKTKPMPELK